MPKMKWNDMQQKAIDTRNKSLIVSAAAGSGKTAVLVERIVSKICSEENPVRIDRMLIVTFTRAAANEMRERISKALDQRIKEDPNNRYLLKQKMMLPLADICTMDQFFNPLVKENFSKLSITPDFRIIDDKESSLISNEVIVEILEEYYEKDDEIFSKLLDVLGCDKDDSALVDCIKTFSRNSNAYPDAKKWLESIKEVYAVLNKPQDTKFGEIILADIHSNLEYCMELIKKGQSLIENVEGLESCFAALKSDEEIIARALAKCENKEWDKLKETLEHINFTGFTQGKGEAKNSYEKNFAKSYRDHMKKILSSLYLKMPATEAEYLEDAEFLKPIIDKFIDIVLEYRKRYFQRKKDENALEFSDIVHFVLELLVKDGEPTQTALELREKYDEILIDEYQDTNEAQDTIFSSISKDDKNLFLVGDVKQSIYRFRLAMPQVFLGKIDLWKEDECEFADFISLDSNYRSRKGVIDAVNYVFERIMSKDAGDIVYDDTQSLKAAASCYEDRNEADVELILLKKPGKTEEYTETNIIAKRIKELLKTTEVYDKKIDGMRPAQYKDICILVRKNDVGFAVSSELNSLGIPSYFEEDKGFLKNTEVTVMLSFLSLINNPLQDIPLISVLMSPIFGFTADDVAKLRISLRYGKLYNAVKNSEDVKCKYFIEKYNEYRRLSSVLSVSELLRSIYEDSGYLSVVGALNNGEIRKLNLMLLIDYAKNYEDYGKSGLSGFIKYIDRMKANGIDFKPAGNISEFSDVVKVMTVHKSKGLEFPIVFLSYCGGKKKNDNDSFFIHEKIGMGVKITDKKTFRKYETVPFSAARILKAKSDCSEELRVLYVAMTRAREKLIITGSTLGKTENTIAKISADCIGNTINPIAVLRSENFLERLLKAFFKHPDAQELRSIAGYRDEFDTKANFKLNIQLINEFEQLDEKEEIAEAEDAPVDENALKLINDKTSYVYPYSALAECSTKVAASSFNKRENDMEFFASDVPEFTQVDGLTAAGRGTAVHRFMETCDFKNAEADISAEKDRLAALGKLTAQQAESLDLSVVNNFFCSDLYKRIKNADKVLREQKFTIDVPVNLAFDELKTEYTDENVLVQGVIDCAFFENGKIVILDYKTDNVKQVEELEQRYHRQLEIYKIAAEKTFLTEVKELILYSFKLNEEKLIKF